MKKKKKFNQRAVLLKCLKILFKYAETFTQNGIQKMTLNKNQNNKTMLLFIYRNRQNLNFQQKCDRKVKKPKLSRYLWTVLMKGPLTLRSLRRLSTSPNHKDLLLTNTGSLNFF